MWRIKFKEAFRFNAGVSDPLKKKIFAKKNKKMEEKILYNFFVTSLPINHFQYTKI